MTTLSRIMVGIPARRFDRMETVDALDQFLYSAYPKWVLGDPGTKATLWKKTLVSPRVDMDRSKLIGMASRFGFNTLWMVDTDVRIHSPFKDVVFAVGRGFDLGYDIVIVPTIQITGPDSFRVMVWPEPNDVKVEPYGINEGAGGFVALSERYLKEMRPIAQARYMDDPTPLPLYCLYPPETSEDISLCREARKQGFKIGAIPNVVVSHEKAWYVTNQLPENTKGATGAK